MKNLSNIFTEEKEILILKEGGRKLSEIMKGIKDFLNEGILVSEIDEKTKELIKSVGALPATVGYKPHGAPYPFPSAACVSINDEVAHGISTNNKRVLKNGDLVSIDVVIKYKGFFIDNCRTYGIGELSKKDKHLLDVSRLVTKKCIKKTIIGNTTEDIGLEAENTANQNNLDTVKELGGHGVGRAIHQDPFIPNAPNLGVKEEKIKEGMLLAVEPIVCEGKWEINLQDDGYLYKTDDGKKTSQFEETVLVTKDGPIILTKDIK